MTKLLMISSLTDSRMEFPVSPERMIFVARIAVWDMHSQTVSLTMMCLQTNLMYS